MQRFFGRDRRKKRQSPRARNRQAALAANPMYQYALQEYAQTVAPTSETLDRRQRQSPYHRSQESSIQSSSPPPSSVHSSSVQQPTTQQQQPQQQQSQQSLDANNTTDQQQQQQQQEGLPISSSASAVSQDNVPLDPIRHSMSAMSGLSDDGLGGVGAGSSFRHRPVSPTAGSDYAASQGAHSATPSSYYHWDHVMNNLEHDDDDPMIPDASYEEYYGDAYVGAPVKYVYPSGYQSMRPRGGPWKLSIGVCLVFTCMSVFIVVHCSDRDAQTLYSSEMNDNTRRWCGSRLVYLMWLISMSITGLAAAYCSVIGYIKVRDFAVANCRSQPSVSVGKSDYYIQIRDGAAQQQQPQPQQESTRHHYIIYQADGTPRFWGAHIYRPTQAAVAVTNR